MKDLFWIFRFADRQADSDWNIDRDRLARMRSFRCGVTVFTMAITFRLDDACYQSKWREYAIDIVTIETPKWRCKIETAPATALRRILHLGAALDKSDIVVEGDEELFRCDMAMLRIASSQVSAAA